MEIKMKTVSNIAAGAALALVLVSFILNAAKFADIDMNDALKAGGFIKAVFLPVDASIWIAHIFGTQGSGGGIMQRDEHNA
jgi:hypothetical protein